MDEEEKSRGIESKGNKSFKRIKKVFLINAILLLPCTYLTLFKFFNADPSVQSKIWTSGFLGLTLPVVFLRILYIPYIVTFAVGIAYFVFLVKEKPQIKDYLFYFVLLIVSILGLFSLEEVFMAAMGI